MWDTEEYHSSRVTAEQILVGLGKPANRIECRCHRHDDATNEIGDQRIVEIFITLVFCEIRYFDIIINRCEYVIKLNYDLNICFYVSLLSSVMSSLYFH